MRCIIITAFVDFPVTFDIEKDDYVICADMGYDIALKNNIVPNIVLGDMDSASAFPSETEYIRFPKEKDDTDTLLCVKYAIDKGFKDIVIIGGIGGRFDHTYANLQTLCYALTHDVSASVVTATETVMLLKPGTVRIKKKDGSYLSVFSYSETCGGVTLCGTKYPLENAVLSNDFPIGVSNEFKGEYAEITHLCGTLLVMITGGL